MLRSSGIQTGRVKNMTTVIFLVGTGELVNQIECILQEEGYEVQHIEWVELNEDVVMQFDRPKLILLVEQKSKQMYQNIQNKAALKNWMNQGTPIPLMVIIPETSPQWVIDWLDFGAYDVMEEPVHWKVFLAKIRNILRLFAKVKPDGEETVIVQDLRINLRSRRVSREGQYLNLTPKEYELLEFLAMHLNEACTRSDILREVWGYEFAMDTNVVDVYIKHLRVKVDKGRDVKLIQTVRGIGYMLHG